jgi:hypothetical protein
MATATKSNPPDIRLQSWVPPDFAAQVKARADGVHVDRVVPGPTPTV